MVSLLPVISKRKDQKPKTQDRNPHNLLQMQCSAKRRQGDRCVASAANGADAFEWVNYYRLDYDYRRDNRSVLCWRLNLRCFRHWFNRLQLILWEGIRLGCRSRRVFRKVLKRKVRNDVVFLRYPGIQGERSVTRHHQHNIATHRRETIVTCSSQRSSHRNCTVYRLSR